MSDKRKTKIQARLKEGYEVDQIKKGIIGCSKSDYHVENKYTDIELICRDASKLDRFIEMVIPNDHQTPDEQQIEQEDTTPPPEIKPIPVKYGQGLGGGK